MKSLNESELSEVRSLIRLLDDEDASIGVVVRQRLVEKGEPVLPYLTLPGLGAVPMQEKKIHQAFEEIASEIVRELFREFRKKFAGDVDLEEGAFLIAMHGYPHEDMTPYAEMLSAFAKELDERLAGVTEPVEILRVMNEFFFVEKGFVGNRDSYYDHDNHYLNKVLGNRRGVPLSLSVVLLLVCWRLNMPLQGIGLPGHFILRYALESEYVYIDPFNSGRQLSRAECMEYVEKAGYEFKEQFLEPISNSKILERMMRNLIASFEKEESPDKNAALLQYIDILNSNV